MSRINSSRKKVIWECIRVKKDNPEVPLEIFKIEDEVKAVVLNKLRIRFLLKSDECWVLKRKVVYEKIDYVEGIYEM